MEISHLDFDLLVKFKEILIIIFYIKKDEQNISELS